MRFCCAIWIKVRRSSMSFYCLNADFQLLFWHNTIQMHSHFDNRCNLISRPKTCVFSIIPKLNLLFVSRYVCVQHLMILFTSISYNFNVTQSHISNCVNSQIIFLWQKTNQLSKRYDCKRTNDSS